MSQVYSSIDKNITSIIDVADAIIRGDFDNNYIAIDAEGVLQELANKINIMLRNLRNVEASLVSAGKQAPNLVDEAVTVVDLMKRTAGEVLDTSDRLSESAERLDSRVGSLDVSRAERSALQENIDSIKNDVFDIIATQTFQDVARQKMEAMIRDMNQLRDWLVECLLVLNIKKDLSPVNVHKKTEMLRDVKALPVEDKNKQDLVDDLLAEFGF